MATLRLVLGDQLTRSVSSLRDLDPSHDVVLMVEANEEATYVRHHKQKIVLVLSAMRHFAAQLRAEGITVDYVSINDDENSGSFVGELDRALERHRPDSVVVTHPGEWRVLDALRSWANANPVHAEIRDDDRFFVTGEQFAQWAKGRKVLRMEHFYREQRRATGILMSGDKPAGDRWNFDNENRKRIPAELDIPPPPDFRPDAITCSVMEAVSQRFGDHFGSVDRFAWPVTRDQALTSLDDFIDYRLARFGDYQDAMRAGEPYLFHAVISASLNIGLLTPREVCNRVEAAFGDGLIPINAAEGFIRQILGWREYVRGLYWHLMPEYESGNALNAQRELPDFYWSGEAPMACVSDVVRQTRDRAYAHHIQRLMVTGNFALLAGVRPAEVEAWYLAVYADAFEWVELPNTHGMALYADGGLLASKPYAASGAYINRMSDYCAGCRYDVTKKTGPDACPFNYLYWSFLIRNEATLSSNPRMAMPYRHLAKWSTERKNAVAAEADAFLESIA